MTYKELISKVGKTELSERLLSLLNKEISKTFVLETDITPYNSSGDRGVQEIFFKGSWEFHKIFKTVNKAIINTYHVFESDNYVDENNFEDYENHIENSELFDLKNIEVTNIDNANRKIEYKGESLMDFYFYQSINAKFINSVTITGFEKSKNFYFDLISESISLLQKNNYKVAYFILFSSFENYINHELNAFEDEERLKDKLKKLCKKRLGNLVKHTIYSSLIIKFKNFTKNRNNIAHGKGDIEITEDNVYELLNFILIFIYIIKTQISEFKELYDKVK